MPVETLDPLDPARRAPLAQRAADLCAAGRLVIAPTETVYGVFAQATTAGAAALRLATAAGDPPPVHTWHAASSESVLDALSITNPLHQRLISRCAPGPVRFTIRLQPGQLDDGLKRLGCPPGIINEGNTVTVRVPDHPFFREMASSPGRPLIAERLGALRLLAREHTKDDRLSPRALELIAAGSDPSLALVVDAGPAAIGRPSTALLLYFTETGAGAYSVTAVGAMDPRAIHRKVQRLILFVCTGNTCRSPMAEAIARAELAKKPQGGLDGHAPLLSGLPAAAMSAGVAAADGEPQSPENTAALQALGVEPLRHRSRALTRDMVRDAEVIYTMTGGHARAVAAIDPSAAAKTRVLDPSGVDVPDPIGQGPRSYALTARRLMELVRNRLDSLEQSGGTT